MEHPLGAVVPESGSGVEPPTVRVRLDLAYDGGPFSGWAKQPGLVTVEGCLEEAAHLVFREPVRFTVAGRTDAGVHAEHQVVHCDVAEPVWKALPGRYGDEPVSAVVRKLNGALTRVLGRAGGPSRPGARPVAVGAILVREAHEVTREFDARFSALSRSYVYRIADGVAHQSPLTRGYSSWVASELDVDVLNRAGRELLGLHDFLSFCKPREGATTVRHLTEVTFCRAESGIIEARLEADAFCHNMVRAVVGACVSVAEGRRDMDWLRGRLANPARDSSIRLAPPEGLALTRIEYPDAGQWGSRAEQTRAKRVWDSSR